MAAIAVVWVLEFSQQSGAEALTAHPVAEATETIVMDGIAPASLVATTARGQDRSALAVAPPSGDESDAPAPESHRTIGLQLLGRRSGLALAGVEVVHSVLFLEGARLGRHKQAFCTDGRGHADVQVAPGGTLRVRAPGHARWSYDVPKNVEDGEMTVLLNAHATLHGRLDFAPGGSTVLIKQMGVTVPAIREQRVNVGPDGVWKAMDVEIASDHTFAAGIDVSLQWSGGQRPLAEGLTLRPGDDRELLDPAAGVEPWSFQLVYGDGEPLSGGASVSVVERPGPDARVISRERTNATGWVTLHGVPPGRWHVHLEDDGRSFGLEATRREGESDLAMTLQGVGRVEGQIVSASGAPLRGLHVHLSGTAASGGVVISSEKGKFRYDLVVLGERPTLAVTDEFRRHVRDGSATGVRSFFSYGHQASAAPSPLAEMVVIPGLEPLNIRLEIAPPGGSLPGDQNGTWSLGIR